MTDWTLVYGVTLAIGGPLLTIVIIMWAGGIWRDTPGLRRFDSGRDREWLRRRGQPRAHRTGRARDGSKRESGRSS